MLPRTTEQSGCKLAKSTFLRIHTSTVDDKSIFDSYNRTRTRDVISFKSININVTIIK